MLPIRLCRRIGRRIDTFTNGFLNDSNNYKADDGNSDAGQNAQNHILRRYPSQQSNQHPDNDRIVRISLSHSSSSFRIHSCLTSKPINSNILSLNIKIRPTQKYNFSCEADFLHIFSILAEPISFLQLRQQAGSYCGNRFSARCSSRGI